VKLSAVIISFNEEANIADAIESVDWADEIIVVDSGSTDRTVEIASKLGAKVVYKEWKGFAEQKNFAMNLASNDLILSLDADERVTPQLRSEIKAIIESGKLADAYRIPRLSIYLGREIRHGGWYPDFQIRLFNRTRGKWNDRIIHESFQPAKDASIGTLKGNLLHYSVRSTREHGEMIASRYAPLGAEQMYREGKTTGPLRAVLSGIAAFFRSYILQAGFMDGFSGFRIAYFAAHNTLLKHLILMDLLDKNRIQDVQDRK